MAVVLPTAAASAPTAGVSTYVQIAAAHTEVTTYDKKFNVRRDTQRTG